MRAIRMVQLSVCLGLGWVLLSGAQKPSALPYIEHTIQSGESVSLLCIQHYGYWSAELGSAFLKLNPAVVNIDVVQVGQVVRLAKAVESGSTPPAPSAPAAEVKVEKRFNATQGVVTYVQGSVNLLRGGKTQSLGVNALVQPGDVIMTAADGRAEIIINRESVIRLDHNTRTTIEAFRDNAAKSGKTTMGFSVGTVWAKIRNFKDQVSRFELELPTAIAGVHGTVYQTSVQPDSSAEVKVFTGEVAVSNRPPTSPELAGGLQEVPGPDEVPGPSEVSMEQWTQIVRDMQRLLIGKDGAASAPQAFTKNPKSEWERWNEQRDKRIAELFEGK